jgi:ubiquinone/menaquinone biosynthesis C-methylase UbiE
LRVEQAAVPIEVVRASAESLPFLSNSFDIVVGTLFLCTIPDPLAALSEIRRVCKPGGTVFLFEHVRSDHNLMGKLQDWLTPAWKRLCGGCHLNRNTLELVKQAGFQITDVEWMYKKLFLIVGAKNEK